MARHRQRPDDCKQLCSKLDEKGRMASVETPELFDKLNQRLSVLATLVRNMVIWVPMSRKKDGWVDSHTGNEIAKLEFEVKELKRAAAAHRHEHIISHITSHGTKESLTPCSKPHRHKSPLP